MRALFVNDVSNLGDQLCILRVLHKYAERFSDDRIDVMTPTFTELYRDAPFVHRVFKATMWRRWLGRPPLARLFGWYGRVVHFDLQEHGLCNKCREMGMHLIQAYAECVPLRVHCLEPYVYYQAEPYRAQALARVERPFIAVAPHSPSCLSRVKPGSPPNKEWPQENWGRLIDELPKAYHVYSFGAAGEQPPEHPRIRPLYGLDLRVVAEMLWHADLFIGLDNGLAHLARAVGQTNIVQIHGTHCPLSWATYPGNRVVHNARPISEVPVQPVAEAARLALADHEATEPDPAAAQATWPLCASSAVALK